MGVFPRKGIYSIIRTLSTIYSENTNNDFFFFSMSVYLSHTPQFSIDVFQTTLIVYYILTHFLGEKHSTPNRGNLKSSNTPRAASFIYYYEI